MSNGSGDLLAVHTSDLHIDGRFAGEFHPLCRVLETAKTLEADLILLAGDIFDHNRVPLAQIDAVARMLGDAETQIVVLPGNHDPITADSVYRRGGLADVPIIGCGGITTGEDAIEFLLAGASAVQVGTATFRSPRAALDVLEGIGAYMRDEGVEDVASLVGAAHESKTEPRPARAAG